MLPQHVSTVGKAEGLSIPVDGLLLELTSQLRIPINRPAVSFFGRRELAGLAQYIPQAVVAAGNIGLVLRHGGILVGEPPLVDQKCLGAVANRPGLLVPARVG